MTNAAGERGEQKIQCKEKKQSTGLLGNISLQQPSTPLPARVEIKMLWRRAPDKKDGRTLDPSQLGESMSMPLSQDLIKDPKITE